MRFLKEVLNSSGVETYRSGSSGALPALLNIACHSEYGSLKVITAWKSSRPRTTLSTWSKPLVVAVRYAGS